MKPRNGHRLRHSLALAATLALALPAGGCWLTEAGEGGSREGAEQVDQARAAPAILVATTRAASETGQPPYFTSQRGTGLSFARARVAATDPSLIGRAAGASGGWQVGGIEGFTDAGAADAFARAALGRDVLLYVHGYRETFESAAVSAAELSGGIAFRGAPALFSWPSGGRTLDYAYDRESALWSRDALEELLRALAATPSGGRVHIVAHSMGSFLTLEALRSLSAGDGSVMDRIGAVVLASPDVDVDLFTRSIERLGPGARKVTVISASNDRALAVSRRIAGGVVRAGAADRAKLEPLGVRVADASDYGGYLINHDLFLSNDDVRQVVKRAIERAGG